MSSKIDNLIASARRLYSRLSGPQRIAIVIVVGVLLFVFFSTVGVKQSPPRMELGGFKPYRPERREVAGGNTIDQDISSKEGDFPEPRGARVEISILEEIRSLKSQIEELRSTVVKNMSESAEKSANDKVLSAISQVREDLRPVTSELKAVKEKLKRDNQALKEQSPIELLAIVSASGFNYAILRTEAGDKRVTEGDKVGPWVVEKIKGREVHLSTSSQKRILTVK